LAGLPLVDDEDGVANPLRRGHRIHLDGIELAPVRRVLPQRIEAGVHARRAAILPGALLLALLERATSVDALAAFVDVTRIVRVARRRIGAVGDDVERASFVD